MVKLHTKFKVVNKRNLNNKRKTDSFKERVKPTLREKKLVKEKNQHI